MFGGTGIYFGKFSSITDGKLWQLHFKNWVICKLWIPLVFNCFHFACGQTAIMEFPFSLRPLISSIDGSIKRLACEHSNICILWWYKKLIRGGYPLFLLLCRYLYLIGFIHFISNPPLYSTIWGGNIWTCNCIGKEIKLARTKSTLPMRVLMKQLFLFTK